MQNMLRTVTYSGELSQVTMSFFSVTCGTAQVFYFEKFFFNLEGETNEHRKKQENSC